MSNSMRDRGAERKGFKRCRAPVPNDGTMFRAPNSGSTNTSKEEELGGGRGGGGRPSSILEARSFAERVNLDERRRGLEIGSV